MADIIYGTIITASGVLGSASGEWTPAAGTFNVPVGTVFNIAAVPSGAKIFHAQSVSGTGATYGSTWGVTTPSGSAWIVGVAVTGSSYVAPGSINAISGTTLTGTPCTIYDSTYYGNGYYQINSGYLQFVISSAGASASSTNTIRWGVS
ncbi:MAG: hypothetical protein ACYCVD_04270 [Desulfitobacteriaceae bacterium]